jgi:hypothetical protein
LTSARPGARGLERHLTPEDLDEHASRPFAAEIEVSLRVLEEPQAHRRKVRLQHHIPFIQGEGLLYDDPKTIPAKPTLKMSKNKDEKLLIIVFESGYRTNIYGKLKASYRLEYKED